MKKFTTIWLGQLVSILGTGMTRFALIVYVFQETTSVISTVLVSVFSLVPFIIASLFSGPIIDRYSRKWIMIFSDLSAGLCTLLLFVFFMQNNLSFAMVLLCQMIAGAAEAFQVPAYTASISTLITKKNYNKANSMRSFSSYASKLLAPILAGFLYSIAGLEVIFIIDFLTFLVGVFALLLVSFPKGKPLEKTYTKQGFLQAYKESFAQIKKVDGLLHLMVVFLIINLLSGITYFGILPAFVMTKTGDNLIFGWVEFFLGFGGILGSLLVFLLPVPKKKTRVLFLALLFSFLLGDLAFAILDSHISWYFAAALTSICVVVIMANETNIWQSKIASSLQGRIFTVKYTINLISLPIGYLIGGVLAEYMFEPIFAAENVLSQFFFPIVERGAGSGMAFMFLLTSIFGILLSIYGLFSSNIRSLDIIKES